MEQGFDLGRAMRWFVVAGALALLVVGGSFWCSHEAAIDGCLDRGGRWNAEQRECEFGPKPARD